MSLSPIRRTSSSLTTWPFLWPHYSCNCFCSPCLSSSRSCISAGLSWTAALICGASLLLLWVTTSMEREPLTPHPFPPAHTFSSRWDSQIWADHPISQVLQVGRGARALRELRCASLAQPRLPGLCRNTLLRNPSWEQHLLLLLQQLNLLLQLLLLHRMLLLQFLEHKPGECSAPAARAELGHRQGLAQAMGTVCPLPSRQNAAHHLSSWVQDGVGAAWLRAATTPLLVPQGRE